MKQTDASIININNSNISKLKNFDEIFLIILIGPPASGKSTFTNSVKAFNDSAIIHSTDDYFMVNGKYVFDQDKISQYHKQNFRSAVNSMREKSHKVVIIDNTNLSVSEFKEYVKAANTYGYKTLFHIFNVSEEELKKRSKKRKDETGKDIGDSVIERMVKKFDDNIESIKSFISKYNQGYFQDKLDTSDVSNFVYSGIFFRPEEILKMSKDLNLNLRPNKLLNEAHVTLMFGKNREEFADHIDKIEKKLGKEIPVVVKKILSNHRVKTALVTIPSGIDNKISSEPHITLEVYGDAKPVESNNLIEAYKKGIFSHEVDHVDNLKFEDVTYALVGKIGLYTKQNTIVYQR